MLYNELEQEDILSGVCLRLATIAYVDILLRSIGPVQNAIKLVYICVIGQ